MRGGRGRLFLVSVRHMRNRANLFSAHTTYIIALSLLAFLKVERADMSGL